MSFFDHVKAGVPVLSAILVGSLTAASLCNYTPNVYGVTPPETFESEIETESQTSVSANPVRPAVVPEAETEAEIVVGQGSFDLDDGTYEGEGKGFGGTTEVSVEIKDKSIISIDVTSNKDDAAYFNLAKDTIINEIITEQSFDVDTVSGATYSSKGIIAAVKNAVTGEEDTSSTGSSSSGSSSSGSGSKKVKKVSEPDSYEDGTYYGTGTGFSGTTKVKVVIKKGKISSIKVVKSGDDSKYLSKAKKLLKKIIKKQSTNVDTISGATYSSNGLIEAVRDALEDAEKSSSSSNNNKKKSSSETETETEKITGTVPYKDGVYYGTAEGYNDDITVAVSIEDKTIVAIIVTEASDDDPFYSNGKTVIQKIIAKQSTEVDTISGATYTSTGVLNAVKEALKEADKATNPEKYETEESTESETETQSSTEETNSADSKDQETESSSDSGNSDSQDETTETKAEEETKETKATETEKKTAYKDGTYSATEHVVNIGDDEWDEYDITVSLTIKDDILNTIAVTSKDVGSNKSFLNKASTNSKKGFVTLLQGKTASADTIEDWDTVSNATCTSNAVKSAAQAALKKAKN